MFLFIIIILVINLIFISLLCSSMYNMFFLYANALWVVQYLNFLKKYNYGTHFTDALLSQCGDDTTLKTVKEELERKDLE